MKVFFIFLLFFQYIFAIDQRSLLRILNYRNEYASEQKIEVVRKQHWISVGKKQSIDLGQKKETFAVQGLKIDGVDWFKIFFLDKEVFSLKIVPIGPHSRLLKLRKIELSSDVSVLVLFYYEGKIQTLDYVASGRFYFITYENQKKNFYAYKGPNFWIEKEDFRENYFNRLYSLQSKNLAGDGKSELIVTFGNIRHLFIYRGRGDWSSF